MISAQAPPPRAWRHLGAFALLGAVTLLGFAAPFLPMDIANALGPWLERARATPWAPLGAVAAFTLLACVGVPQIVLITALVAVFGPWAGLLYSWCGKMAACSIGFALGRRFGAGFVQRRASPRVAEFMRQLARRGFWASALIRLAPTVPSVLINIAAGAASIRFSDFFFGTALGSAPKMALLAFGGHAAMHVLHENSAWAWALLGLIIVLWAGLAIIARRWLGGRA